MLQRKNVSYTSGDPDIKPLEENVIALTVSLPVYTPFALLMCNTPYTLSTGLSMLLAKMWRSMTRKRFVVVWNQK